MDPKLARAIQAMKKKLEPASTLVMRAVRFRDDEKSAKTRFEAIDNNENANSAWAKPLVA